ncbi:carboxypeptidase-like regulatory domain-containing protein [Croceitalea rosinachiae]|uniref:Carboxypeptidase-like regulatory domain-containing protein n=1 Tax=Croceitalea rosinachiae TaxID=3075596 RepID=A0ABU3ACR7_9FLAO|nr:carboxypeptidase-like regulatory domain-containing protein [Croceitalea sp. F388]MDT0607969.1 carboxypeptidase-like regulatory domain-containing protein [Croceitalea sp. F388]
MRSNFQSTFFIILLLFTASISAQTFSAKVIDGKTKKEIPYATVQYAENEGVITNDEGRFSFTIKTNSISLDSIYISSMGYARTGFTLEQLKDSVLIITPKAIELSGVYLFDKELEADEIIEKMIEKLPENTNSSPIKQRFFLRQSVFGNIQKIDFGFEKSSIEELDKTFVDSIGKAIPKNSYHYTESLGDFYTAGSKNKIAILKAAELYDKKDVGSFEDFSKKMKTIFEKNIKPDSYLKIKSGIFSEKVQVDSIMLDLETEEAAELKKEMENDTISSLVDNQKSIFDELLQEVYYEKDTKLNVVDKYRKYSFELAGYSDIENQGVYVIDFFPKGGADFKGRLFINIEDFAVMRIDFENLKNLRNFRLLGIFYRETIYKGSMQFTKLTNGRYDLKFIDFNFGRWFRIDRPLDIIEKNKNVKGRRKQNELKLNIDFRMTNTNKWELVVFENTLIEQSSFEALKEDKSKKATYMAKYDPNFWKGYNIMEPNQAIKEFTVAEEE